MPGKRRLRRLWDAVDPDGDVTQSIVIFSACALVMTGPAGFAMRSWLLPILTVPVVAVLCIVGHWIIVSDSRTLALGVVGWVAGVATGLGLLVSGIVSLVRWEPECVPTETVECRWYYGVAEGDEASVAEQRRDHAIPVVLYLIVPGTLLLLAMGWWGIRFVQDRRSPL